MSRIAVFFADGFEEIEGLTPVDMARRAGIEVTTVSIMDTQIIEGSHRIFIKADEMFKEGSYDEYDMLLLPGGGVGTQNLEIHDALHNELKKAYENGKYIAAICAAPRLLGKLGLLKGRKATCYPGNEGFLEGAEYHPELKALSVGKMITARGMGAATEFGAEVIAALSGREKADEILRQIQF